MPYTFDGLEKSTTYKKQLEAELRKGGTVSLALRWMEGVVFTGQKARNLLLVGKVDPDLVAALKRAKGKDVAIGKCRWNGDQLQVDSPDVPLAKVQTLLKSLSLPSDVVLQAMPEKKRLPGAEEGGEEGEEPNALKRARRLLKELDASRFPMEGDALADAIQRVEEAIDSDGLPHAVDKLEWELRSVDRIRRLADSISPLLERYGERVADLKSSDWVESVRERMQDTWDGIADLQKEGDWDSIRDELRTLADLFEDEAVLEDFAPEDRPSPPEPSVSQDPPPIDPPQIDPLPIDPPQQDPPSPVGSSSSGDTEEDDEEQTLEQLRADYIRRLELLKWRLEALATKVKVNSQAVSFRDPLKRMMGERKVLGESVPGVAHPDAFPEDLILDMEGALGTLEQSYTETFEGGQNLDQVLHEGTRYQRLGNMSIYIAVPDHPTLGAAISAYREAATGGFIPPKGRGRAGIKIKGGTYELKIRIDQQQSLGLGGKPLRLVATETVLGTQRLLRFDTLKEAHTGGR